MKATEIVEKLKDVLLGSQDTEDKVEETEEAPVAETQEEVVEAPEDDVKEIVLSEEEEELAYHDKQKGLMDHKDGEKGPESKFVTKEEFSELKAMVEKLMTDMGAHKDKMNEEVPKEELAAVEEEVAPIVHSPESKLEKKLNLYSQNRNMTTEDRVLAKIAKINQNQ